MGQPLASVIVRCYNEAEHVGKLLHGVFQQSVDDLEVILVDSGSTDGTLEIARQYPVDDIVYIDPEEFSFGRALNYGCAAASGEFCVVASAHVYPTRSDWIEELLAKFDDDDVALVYGKQRGNEVTCFSEKQIFKQWFPDEDIYHQNHPFCNNANAAIRRELWEEFNYDEQLTGLEDVDWAKRVQNAGYEICYAGEAEVIHVHDETSRQVFNRYRREAYAHKQIMPEQTFSIWDFLKLSTYHIVSDFRAAVDQGVVIENLLDIPRFRLLQFAGTYRGFSKEGPIPEDLWQRFFYPDRNSYPGKDERRERPERTEDDGESDRGNEIEYPDFDELSNPG